MTQRLRWYQTTVARVYAIVTFLLYCLGFALLALVAAAPVRSDPRIAALAVMLVLFDILRRLHRLERKRP